MGWREKGARVRDLVAVFLPDYVRLVEPDLAPCLDLSDVVPSTPREMGADWQRRAVFAEALSCKGEKVKLLVHVEPGPGAGAGAGEALAQSLRALRLPLGEPVWLSVVLLRGGRPGINLETVRAASLGRLETVRLYYTAFGLQASRAEYYLARPEPVAWALSALMSPSAGRAEHQRACEERIRTAALDVDCRELLLTCVESFQVRP